MIDWWWQAAICASLAVGLLFVLSSRPTVRTCVGSLLLAVATVAVVVTSQGLPRPFLSVFDHRELRVIAAQVVPEEAIYLWVDDDMAPLAYRIPWSDEAAQQLGDALTEARNRGDDGIMFRTQVEYGDRMFYPIPVQGSGAKLHGLGAGEGAR